MAGDTVITVVGNLTADPDLTFTPSGAAVANFTIASTPRRFNSQTQQWEDGEALFLRCNLWRQAAENAADSLKKGMRVIAQGRLRQRSFQTREGENRSVIELEVDEIGPSLRYATAAVEKVQRGGSGNFGGQQQGGGYGGGQNYGGGQQAPRGGQPQQQGGGYGGGYGSSQDQDPWGSAPQSGGGAFGAADDDPPF